MAFPPPPSSTFDWSNIGFQVRQVNGHVQCQFSRKTGQWTKPVFVKDPNLRIHGMSPGLNYGQQAYEGIKAFRTPTGEIQIFRPDRNAIRMRDSAVFNSMPAIPTDLFINTVKAAVSLNAEFVPPHETGAAMYIRPLLFASSAQLGLNPPTDEYMLCVFVTPTGVYHGVHPVKALILDEFDRAAPFGTGSAKIGGNYAPTFRWAEIARQEGYGITLHLDSATHTEVDEFSTSGFIGALVDGDQVTLVVPDSKSVIDSVTSSSVVDIGASFGWKVEKRSIKYIEFSQFSEVMAAGTAAGLLPIRSITRRIDPTSASSITATIKDHARLSSDQNSETVTYAAEDREDAIPICLKLLTQLKGIQMGKVKDPFGWSFAVSEEDGLNITQQTPAMNGNGNSQV